ncbi:M56 family metallopeptidase [Patulibacter sp. NPDC049589]|uniref:M56 family metallopeptidase n=1 Tax=Patulibacter sp. NPDC049589 TaxID=3154731 RepID=UPI00343D30BC
MIALLALLVVAAVLLPHVVPLRRVAPATAATLWGVALGLRALTSVFVALYLVLFLPATALFDAMTHWCWHTIIPIATTHLGVAGHRVGDAVAIFPVFLLAASAISLAFGLVRAARSVRRLITRDAVGRGPADSVIVGGPDVFVAAAGFSHPRLVVSAGALTQLDDEELAAGIDHEHGHIRRRHRFVVLYAEACRALARFVPGTKHAVAQLRFHLERDADAWALARKHDRFALASAICKATIFQNPAVAPLGGGRDVRDRVDELLSGHRAPGALRRSALNATAALGVVLLLGLTASVPSVVAAGQQQADGAPVPHACDG